MHDETGTRDSVELTEHELELVTIALIAYKHRTTPRTLEPSDQAAAGRLINRLGSELMRRREPIKCPHGRELEDNDCPQCMADAAAIGEPV